jgi:hypothetical protein
MGPKAAFDGCREPRPRRYSIPRSSTPYRIAIPSTLAGTIKTLISLRNLLCGTDFYSPPACVHIRDIYGVLLLLRQT